MAAQKLRREVAGRSVVGGKAFRAVSAYLCCCELPPCSFSKRRWRSLVFRDFAVALSLLQKCCYWENPKIRLLGLLEIFFRRFHFKHSRPQFSLREHANVENVMHFVHTESTYSAKATAKENYSQSTIIRSIQTTTLLFSIAPVVRKLVVKLKFTNTLRGRKTKKVGNETGGHPIELGPVRTP